MLDGKPEALQAFASPSLRETEHLVSLSFAPGEAYQSTGATRSTVD